MSEQVNQGPPEVAPTQALVNVQPIPRQQALVVEDNSNIAYLMDSARFAHMQRIARLMAQSSLTPKHLAGNSIDQACANCFRVCNQAVRWGFDPFAVVDETYVVNGKLGYQGKLIAAVVHAKGGLIGRLRATYDGTGDARTVTIAGQFKDEDDVRTIELSVSQARTSNDMWKKDPDQKLWYTGVTKWARRHCPEVIMGIMTDDDLDRIDHNPPAEPPVGRHRVSELANGNGHQEPRQTVDEPKAQAPDEAPKETSKEQTPAADRYQKLIEEIRRTQPDVPKLLVNCKVKSLDDLTAEQIEEWIDILRNEPTAEQPEKSAAVPKRSEAAAGKAKF